MSEMSRRGFLKRSLGAGAAGASILYGLAPSTAAAGTVPIGLVIDLTKCDGCKGEAQ